MPTRFLFKQAFVWGMGAQLGSMFMNVVAKVATPFITKATKELEKKWSTKV